MRKRRGWKPWPAKGTAVVSPPKSKKATKRTRTCLRPDESDGRRGQSEVYNGSDAGDCFGACFLIPRSVVRPAAKGSKLFAFRSTTTVHGVVSGLAGDV